MGTSEVSERSLVIYFHGERLRAVSLMARAVRGDGVPAATVAHAKGHDMTAVPFSIDSFELVLQAMAKGAFENMPPTERLAGLRTMFEGAVRRGEDKLALEALQCWSMALKDAQEVKDQQTIERDKLDILISMFLVVHEQYKARDYQGMNEALLGVYREILLL